MSSGQATDSCTDSSVIHRSTPHLPTFSLPHPVLCVYGCACRTLCDAAEGGPFNRLILQSESGGDWEAGDEGGDAEGLMDVEGHDTTAQACWELYCRDTAMSTPERVNRGVASEMIYPKWCPQLADK